MTATKLTWSQVTAWRLQQQYLAERAGLQDWRTVVGALGGLHAQLMSAAELSLWARVENLPPQTVATALWQERTLVKTWAMRGTLHCLPVTDFALHIAARQASLPKRPPSWYRYHGVTPPEAEAIFAALPQILSDEPQTREAVADLVVAQTQNPALRAILLSGWGALLKPSAFAGDLCFGPNQGQNVTFVQPRAWLGAWPALEPKSALMEMGRRFLQRFGPATLDEFARWWGMQPAQARPIFKALGKELCKVDIEGWPAFALDTTLEAIQTRPTTPTVRLLPFFDPYTIAVARHSQFVLAEDFKARVYRSQGWIAPVLLMDGRMIGVWDLDKTRTTITLEYFEAPPDSIHQGIKTEIARLQTFLGSELNVRISDTST